MQHLLSSFAVVLGLALLYKVAAKNERASSWPVGLVAYSGPFFFLIYFCWICVAGFLVFGVVEGPNSPGELVAGICALTALAAAVLVLHLEVHGVKIEYDDEGIHATSPWRPQRHIAWSDICDVRFSQAAQWYVIRRANGGPIRCHVWLSGLTGLMSELDKRGYTLSGNHPYRASLPASRMATKPSDERERE